MRSGTAPRYALRPAGAQRSCPRRSLLAGLALLGFLLVPVSAFAHPVIYLDFRIEFKLNAHGLQGFWETWRFDAPHSVMIVKMFKLRPEANGAISRGQLPTLKRGFFDNLKDYNYFSSIVVDGKELPTKRVSHFSASFVHGRMFYHFFVPLVVPATDAEQEVDVTCWDPTYYTDLSPEGHDAVTVEGPSSITATVSVANDHRHFYNLAPDIVLIKKPPFYLKMQVIRFRLAG